MDGIVIRLPEIARSISINAEWTRTATELLQKASAITAVVDKPGADAAGDVLLKIQKHARALEAQRKAITAPLVNAKKTIDDACKVEADKLASEKEKLSALIADWSSAERRRVEEENRRAEQERQEQIERELEAKRQAESAPQNLFEAPPETPAVVIAPVVQLVAPKVSGVKQTETLTFEVVDPDAVPRVFLVVDERKIREWIAGNKTTLMEKLKANPGMSQPIDGVKITITLNIGAR